LLREPPTYDFGPALWRGADIDVDAGSGDVVVIPDAAFLFNADFKKAGRDLLILGDDGRKVVVHDYFAHDKRPDLASREGATIAGYVVDAIVKQTSPTEYAQAGTPSNAANPIGRVEKVTGSAIAIRNGVPVTLNAGDLVFQGDVVQTRGGSTLGIAFIDGSAFNLSANARMVLNELVYDPNGTANSSLVNLVQGTISFVAGQVAKTGDMKVGTPVATMGIRGTIVIVEMAADNGPTKIRTVFDPQTGKPGEIVAYSNANPTEVIGRLNVETLALQITPLSNLNVVVVQVPVSPLEISSSRELSARLIEISNAALQNPIVPGVVPDATSPGGTAPGGAGGGGGSSSPPPNSLGGGTNGTTTTGALTATTTAFTTPTTIVVPSDTGGGAAGGGAAGARNALPVLVADASAAAPTNPVSLSGTLPFTDEDKGDTHQAFVQGASAQWTSGAGAAVTTAIPAETAAALGTALTVGIAAESGDGPGTVSWSFALAESLSRFLGAGEHLAVTYTIQVSDGSGQSAPRTVTVVLLGDNDNPELSAGTGGSDTEISGVTGGPGSHAVAGSLGFTDPDLTDAHGIAATTISIRGTSSSLQA
jgi:VCBS repeat-containing protein